MTIRNIKAVLLLGPTGAGKTPLGDLLEKKGVNGRKCFHFDFGRNLRRAASGNFCIDLLPSADIDFIKDLLSSGALLENETFYIAEKILTAFIHTNKITENDLIIMNGLPRHIDQARDTAAMLTIQSLIVLECPPEVVHERIRSNSGGDRTRRKDDSLDEIRNKLEIYCGRTLPLLHYFETRNVPLTHIQVNVDTSPEKIISQLS